MSRRNKVGVVFIDDGFVMGEDKVGYVQNFVYIYRLYFIY